MQYQIDYATKPLWLWILLGLLLAIILLSQSVFIFRDAQKRGVFPWFWGLWGMMQTPTPLVVYYFVVMRRKKKLK